MCCSALAVAGLISILLGSDPGTFPPIVSLRAGRRRLAILSRSNTLAYLDS